MRPKDHQDVECGNSILSERCYVQILKGGRPHLIIQGRNAIGWHDNATLHLESYGAGGGDWGIAVNLWDIATARETPLFSHGGAAAGPDGPVVSEVCLREACFVLEHDQKGRTVAVYESLNDKRGRQIGKLSGIAEVHASFDGDDIILKSPAGNHRLNPSTRALSRIQVGKSK